MACMLPHESHHVVGHRSFGDDRFIAAGSKQLGERPPEREAARDNRRLHFAVAPSLERGPDGRAGKSLAAAREINRSSVVGIDPAKVPGFGPLVKIRPPRPRELYQNMR